MRFTVYVRHSFRPFLWQTDRWAIENRSRLAFRNGVLVVFGRDAGHALDAATGEHLWSAAGPERKSLYMGKYYQQPLTDLYLKSRGTRGIAPSNACSYSIYANGIWYGHARPVCPLLVGRVPGEKPDVKGSTVCQVVWEQ